MCVKPTINDHKQHYSEAREPSRSVTFQYKHKVLKFYFESESCCTLLMLSTVRAFWGEAFKKKTQIPFKGTS